MIGFVLTGHGLFPEGMFQSVQLITGEIAQMKVVSFESDTDALHNELVNAMEDVDHGDGVVCFADLAGGTPFNVCSKIAAQRENVRVIGGANVPMLLSGVFQREQELDTFTEAIMQEGKDNVKPFEVKKKEETSSEVDGI